MLKAFFGNKKWILWAYGGAMVIILSLYAQVQMSVMINTWYGNFYNLLQTAGKPGSTLVEFQAGLLKFMQIALPYCILATITSYFTRLYSFRWRQAITEDYIPRWRNVSDEIEGASQRIQEDSYRFSRIVESLGMQVAEATMTLIAFIPILWVLSAKVDVTAIPYVGTHPVIILQAIVLILMIVGFSVARYAFSKRKAKIDEEPAKEKGNLLKTAAYLGAIALATWGLSALIYGIPLVREVLTAKNIPGFLVWLSLIVSGGGMVASWFIGGKLPGLEYNNQKVEAAFRKELVLGEDDKQNHSSVETLAKLFTGLRFNYHRLFLHYGYFDLWRTLFAQFMVIVPYIIMGPGLFTGLITLGVLIQVSNSFDQVRGSFSLFINNWTTVTELRSIVKRLKEFQLNLDKHQMPTENTES